MNTSKTTPFRIVRGHDFSGEPCQLVHQGERSAARQALTARPLAPRAASTLTELQDPSRRPATPESYQAVDQDLRDFNPVTALQLPAATLVRNLRRTRKGAAPGPSGLTAETLRLLLDGERAQTSSSVLQANSLAPLSQRQLRHRPRTPRGPAKTQWPHSRHRHRRHLPPRRVAKHRPAFCHRHPPSVLSALKPLSAIQANPTLTVLSPLTASEPVEDFHLLGFNIDLPQRTITYMQPSQPWKIRDPTTAGSQRLALSGLQSRLHTIRKYAFPPSSAEAAAAELVRLYVQKGHNHHACHRFLKKAPKTAICVCPPLDKGFS